MLKFKVTGEGDKIQFQLQSGRKLPEASASNNENTEDALNKVYNGVRAETARRAA